MQNDLLIHNCPLLTTYLKVLMERSWTQQLKHQTIVTLKTEYILKVQNIWCLSVNDKYF